MCHSIGSFIFEAINEKDESLRLLKTWFFTEQKKKARISTNRICFYQNAYELLILTGVVALYSFGNISSNIAYEDIF